MKLYAGIAAAVVVLGIVAALFMGKSGPSGDAATGAAAPAAAGGGDAVAQFPMMFGNAKYNFELSRQGVLRKISTGDGRSLVDAIGLTNLQGSYVTGEGKRAQFNADGLGNMDYTATVTKEIASEGVVFKVHIKHARFELHKVITCLPASIRASVTFTPLLLREQNGAVSAVYAVKIDPASIIPRATVEARGTTAVFSTVPGKLKLSYDDTAWARYGAGGKQAITMTDSSVAFSYVMLYSSDRTDSSAKTLNYELLFP